MEVEQYARVKTTILKLLDINLDYYKDEQMKRRLDSWLVRSGMPDWENYFHRLRSDTNELSKFRNYLTINVSSFFRDAERWSTVRQEIIPELLRTAPPVQVNTPTFQIWSAGCSIGPEPYTLAMLMDESFPGRRYHILATDLDRGALNHARCLGPYTTEQVSSLTSAQKAAFFQPGGPPYFVKDTLSKKIEFREHNILSDPFPSGLDLIVCRNVVIYFTNQAKDELYRKFQNALRPGGILFVGATEMIPRPQDIGLKGCGISFYRKV